MKRNKFIKMILCILCLFLLATPFSTYAEGNSYSIYNDTGAKVDLKLEAESDRISDFTNPPNYEGTLENGDRIDLPFDKKKIYKILNVVAKKKSYRSSITLEQGQNIKLSDIIKPENEVIKYCSIL